ncbi:MAG TPA: MaoC family dehydratase N-terminal domain-containing protein [Burkholderiaceae bacterium]|nr:MaoC family dehydratase N-terminal domain-containing protein [Burkholderiaceae bacterium]
MIDMQSLKQWKGKTATWNGRITEEPIVRMAATLGRPDIANRSERLLPPLWHWLYGAPALDESQLQADGMPRGSDIVPPVPLPRRMWASSALQFHNELHIGDMIRKQSEVTDIVHKQGRSGELVFVELLHTLAGPKGVALTERHTIAFRDAEPSSPPAPKVTPAASNHDTSRKAEAPALPEAEYSRDIVPTEISLFLYSALTFNSHRIHYDRPYATEVEGYPGLVVHGPLIASLLLDLVDRHFPDRGIQDFAFKAVRPIFDLHPFSVNMRLEPGADKRFTLWASDHTHNVCMQAEGAFR